jgi:hypothetical protein
MLEFYLIPDAQATPDYPEQAALPSVGGLDLPTFGRLQARQIIAGRFSYWEDFRWDLPLIEQLLAAALQARADTDLDKLMSLLREAQTRRCGLVAYAD